MPTPQAPKLAQAGQQDSCGLLKPGSGLHMITGASLPCRALLGAHAHLRSSALLALTKLMAIDPGFCEANLALVFTLLEKRQVAACAPITSIIALSWQI